MINTLFFDLDGVFIRRFWKRPVMGDQKSLAVIFDFFQSLEPKGQRPRIIFVTDRSAGQLPGWVWMYKGDRFHAGEGGAVVYDRDRNIEWVDDAWLEYKNVKRPAIVEYLQNKIGLGLDPNNAMLAAGEKKVHMSIEPPSDMYGKRFGDLLEEVLKDCPYRDSFWLEKGSAPAIIPKGMSKEFAIPRLVRLYQEINNPLDLSSCAWIADNDRDVPFGKILLKHGGTVCGVGNSSDKYSEFLRDNNGILVSKEYEQGVLQILKQLF